MYRIELRPGEETALRTIEELAVGIRNGVITSRARVWHNAGQKWLPIEFHPHYRTALQQLERGEAEPAATVATPLAVPLPAPKPAAVESSVAFASAPVIEADRSAVPPAAARRRTVGRSIGLFVVGGLVIAGAKLATSRTPLDLARASAADTPAAADARPAEDSRRTSALPATMVIPAAEPAAPMRKTIAGGGVVRGPTEVSPPAPPPVNHPAIADDTIPSAPPIPALNLTLPAEEKPAPEAAATQTNPDSIAR